MDDEDYARVLENERESGWEEGVRELRDFLLEDELLLDAAGVRMWARELLKRRGLGTEADR